MVQILLYKGANINVRDSKGKIPLDIAQQYGHQDIVDLLSAKPFKFGFNRFFKLSFYAGIVCHAATIFT